MGTDYETLFREYEAFLRKGGCMEPFLGYSNCRDDAEEKNEDAFTMCKDAKKRLDECFHANSYHYRSVLSPVVEATAELVWNKIEAVVTQGDTLSVEPKGGDDDVIGERFYEFMGGGACRESYTAFEDCIAEIEETPGDISKCSKGLTVLLSCMDAHSDYYQPIIDAVDAGLQLFDSLLLTKIRERNDELV